MYTNTLTQIKHISHNIQAVNYVHRDALLFC